MYHAGLTQSLLGHLSCCMQVVDDVMDDTGEGSIGSRSRMATCLSWQSGVSAGDELVLEDIIQGIPEEDKEAQQAALAKAAFEAVTTEYKALEAAITDPSKRAAMADVYKQPWLK